MRRYKNTFSMPPIPIKLSHKITFYNNNKINKKNYNKLYSHRVGTGYL